MNASKNELVLSSITVGPVIYRKPLPVEDGGILWLDFDRFELESATVFTALPRGYSFVSRTPRPRTPQPTTQLSRLTRLYISSA